MRDLLRRICAPILTPLERGDAPFAYKPSHRTILIAMSAMFIGLASLVVWITPGGNFSYLLPVVVFGGAGILGIIVGALGTDRAVAKIWGSR